MKTTLNDLNNNPLKAVVRGTSVEIRSRQGEVLMTAVDTSPKRAIRKLINLIDQLENDRLTPLP